MERIGAVGTTWRERGVAGLAAWTLAPERIEGWLVETAARHGLRELVYLSTCNRVELYFVAPPGASVASLRAPLVAALAAATGHGAGASARELKGWHGEGAAEHLFVVAAGIDSGTPGDQEIPGQVDAAWQRSHALGLSGLRLDHLFARARELARAVRRETGLGGHRASVASRAIAWLDARPEPLGDPVMIVGAGVIAERVAAELAPRGVTLHFVNRTAERAAALAAAHGGTWQGLDTLGRSPPRVATVIAAARGTEPIFGRELLERLAAGTPAGRPLVVVDLAVPPNVDPEAARAVGVVRAGIDDLIAATADGDRDLDGHARLAAARVLVDAALEELEPSFIDRLLGPLAALVQDRYQHTAREGVDRLLTRELPGLGAAERAAIERWAATLARRFAHLPTAGLRAVAHNHGAGALGAWFAHADPQLAAAARTLLDGETVSPSRTEQAP